LYTGLTVYFDFFSGQEQQKEEMEVGLEFNQKATFEGESEFESGLSYFIFFK
jgi:hypothetical protein